MKIKTKKSILMGSILFLILLIGVLYLSFFRERWVSAATFQKDLVSIGDKYKIQRSCEEWVKRMSAPDGGPLIMRGPFRICHKIGRMYGKKAKCVDGEMFVLCGDKIEN